MERVEKKKMVALIACIVAVIFVIAIFDSWNSMWYQFGGNIYHILHK